MTLRSRRPGQRLAAVSVATLLPFATLLMLPDGRAHAPTANQARPNPGPGMDGAEHPAAVLAAHGFGAATPTRAPSAGGRRTISILQIGDSHTAADIFTGAVRLRLQERFGTGALGFLPAGSPHPGIRSTVAKVSASAGWRYESLQRSPTPENFGLSGYNATASADGETLTFATEAPTRYGLIEIEARTGPGAGSIAVEVDDRPVQSIALASAAAGALVLPIAAPGGRDGTFRRLVLRTTSAQPVTISGLTVLQRTPGLSYSAVGYPGATVDILARLPPRTLTDAVSRRAPDVIVLAFGTNEGFNDKLDLAAYRARYRAVLGLLRQAAPQARLVMIGPPQSERVAPECKPGPGSSCAASLPAASMPATSVPAASMSATSMSATSAPAGEDDIGTAEPDACRTRPPRLAGVRDVQRHLAQQEGIPFWDWWAIMPPGCGADRWAGAEPALMAKDHVHFTRAGYRVSGQSFADFLEPQIRSVLRGDNAVSNH